MMTISGLLLIAYLLFRSSEASAGLLCEPCNKWDILYMGSSGLLRAKYGGSMSKTVAPAIRQGFGPPLLAGGSESGAHAVVFSSDDSRLFVQDLVQGVRIHSAIFNQPINGALYCSVTGTVIGWNNSAAPTISVAAQKFVAVSREGKVRDIPAPTGPDALYQMSAFGCNSEGEFILESGSNSWRSNLSDLPTWGFAMGSNRSSTIIGWHWRRWEASERVPAWLGIGGEHGSWYLVNSAEGVAVEKSSGPRGWVSGLRRDSGYLLSSQSNRFALFDFDMRSGGPEKMFVFRHGLGRAVEKLLFTKTNRQL